MRRICRKVSGAGSVQNTERANCCGLGGLWESGGSREPDSETPMGGWKPLWKHALSAATARLRPRGAKVERGLKHAVDAHKTSLESILAAYAGGLIDKPTFDGELAEEKRILAEELSALSGVGPKRARDAANAFVGAIESAA
jgi:hypothetical protein